VSETARSAVQGVVAAMAMTGLRRVTTGLGLLRQPPPDLVAEEGAPGLFGRVPAEHREVAIELAHWAFGAAAGAGFGLLPAAARRHGWAGPAYGVAVWLGFEAGAAPALGLAGQRRWGVSDRLALAADHVLYGLVIAGRPAKPLRR
jgi:hypothetical protein